MDKEIVLKELQFKAIRSSGPGGQHANKVSSKVALTFDLNHSDGLSNTEKVRILRKLHSKLTQEGNLLLQCDESRSQHKNKELVIKRFFHLLESALVVRKKRKRTKPSKSSIERRLKSKKLKSQKKANRNKPEF
ncbi:alternative ribosome rescue aminoacyl-tRNA hydrolase ArfB [Maribacter sp. PR1]|uniref:Alternative ribosome rescue aminoacyl-tRNA hydrolase ArfB n=1 Tax=Maribacter cobaltidurans TaxID=1178778 RepID=A0ABU7IRN7_9FLAO|nr:MULTISPECIES: alternative ribosome rescue aminoacyl-tRNA hydrolase ArfB [Maribacter]MDC6387944.1 alternative ribosome rescue aminoacyl-tRNA hydrolase ArfB [Maribacter sp. PR1]MEE1975333.1 alternative ribosome rescue aminoacyl-tRNA hydrolase ArfB [Maribacter cobaltidurans]